VLVKVTRKREVNRMASQKHLDLLSSGKTLWNNWRRAYADVQAVEPDLHGADLTEADLQGADLREADLRNANLRSANLSDAHLQKAHLRWADVRGATLCCTDLMGAQEEPPAHPGETTLKES